MGQSNALSVLYSVQSGFSCHPASTQCVKWALMGRKIGRSMKRINNLLDEGVEVKYAFFYYFSRDDTG
jgi:hypothetical protein